MTHLMEPVLAVLPTVSDGTHDKNCVFCKEAKAKGPTSYIGADNNSGELEKKLTAASVPRRTFTHPDHGKFSSEPHHLMPGNEALKGHDVEKWFATKASGSKVKADTGFDINSAFNGAWLPSVPVGLVGVAGWNWRDNDCQTMAIDLMLKENLQFHKGGHTNKGGLDRDGSAPDRCYITTVEGRLDNLLEYLEQWKTTYCPIEKEKKKNEKANPPFFLNDLAYRYVSAWMMKEVSGPPEKWKVFVSRVSYAAHLNALARPKKKRKSAAKKTVKRSRTK